jgi:hypothetical protein
MSVPDAWIEEEFGWCDLGDERLQWRLKRVVKDLADHPMASLPQACEDAAALKATYRFLDNPSVKASELLISHQRSNLTRLRQHPVVLAVQDTTFLDFTAHPSTQGLGMLAKRENQGLCSHNTLAFTPERLPLGLLQQQVWVRDQAEEAKPDDHKMRPLDQKESQKWLSSLEAVHEIAPLCPDTLLVSVGDREADVYDLFLAPREANVHLLVRACQDRCLEPSGRLKSQMEAAPIAATVAVNLPRRHQQAARSAQLSVGFQTLTLRPPKHRASEQLACVSVGGILVREDHPPEGSDPIDWLLITTVPLTCVEQALQCLDWYCVRWQIEVWHKVLKSGCRIEALQLGHADRLERCLALYSVIAWRLLYATMLSRTCPEFSCELLLDPAEWQALYCHLHKRSVPPVQAPSLKTAVGWIGQLGGYLARKADGPPGVTVLWRGLQRLSDIAEMYRIMSAPPPLVGKA